MASSANESSVLSYELIVTSPPAVQCSGQRRRELSRIMQQAVRPESSSAETLKTELNIFVHSFR